MAESSPRASGGDFSLNPRILVSPHRCPLGIVPCRTRRPPSAGTQSSRSASELSEEKRNKKRTRCSGNSDVRYSPRKKTVESSAIRAGGRGRRAGIWGFESSAPRPTGVPFASKILPRMCSVHPGASLQETRGVGESAVGRRGWTCSGGQWGQRTHSGWCAACTVLYTYSRIVRVSFSPGSSASRTFHCRRARTRERTGLVRQGVWVKRQEAVARKLPTRAIYD